MMNNINWYYVALYIPAMGVLLSLLSIIQQYCKNIADLRKMNSFQNFETIAEYYFERSYTTIYKDKILVFSAEGMSPREEDIKDIQHQYLDLTVKMMGNWIFEQLVDYYGSESTLYFNALTFFDNHYENDAIKDMAIDKQIQTG